MPTDTAPRSGSSSSVGGMLTKKYGGVPMYVYFVGAVIVGGIVWFYIRRRSNPSGATAAQPATSQAAAAGMTPAGVSSVPFIPVTEVSGLSQAPGSTATAPAAPFQDPIKGLAFHFGGQAPADKSRYVWRLTQGGMDSYKKMYGRDWTGGVQPGYSPTPNLGAEAGYSWEWAALPDNMTFEQLIRGSAGVGGASDTGGTGGPYSPWQGFAQTSVPQQYAVVGGQPWGNQSAAGIGGPYGGARRALLDPLAMAAGRANIPTARVLALNTDLRRKGGWIAPPGSVIRVA